MPSFYEAFAELIKRIVNNGEDQINTRFKGDDIASILDSLPTVIFDEPNEDTLLTDEEPPQIPGNEAENVPTTPDQTFIPSPVPAPRLVKNDPNRSRLILDIYHLNTSSSKLLGLFNELKRVPVSYNNSVAAAMRIFLDLAVLNYIEAEGLESDICALYNCGLRDVQLKKRLEYIKTNKLAGNPQTIVHRLLDQNMEYSLDVLNGYIHSNDTHYSSKQFLNRFWDFLFPLFEKILDITEDVF